MHIKAFALSALDSATNGGRRYHVWMGSLTLVILVLSCRPGTAARGSPGELSSAN